MQVNFPKFKGISISIAYLFLGLWLSACTTQSTAKSNVPNQYIKILGVTQDAGYPQIGCQKSCCKQVLEGNSEKQQVVSLGVIDHVEDKHVLIEASPDIVLQVADLLGETNNAVKSQPDAIFITHAHIGHYTGLMYLGKEAMFARKVETYVMPRLANFLQTNGPWDLLCQNQNIIPKTLTADSSVYITESIHIEPFLVPHRDEYSETAGFKISGSTKSALFIPDIDKWTKWDRSLIEEIQAVDYAIIDATFFDGEELPGRDMSSIPHPFVVETIDLLKALSNEEKSKVIFIHFNHTNPLLQAGSDAQQRIHDLGYRIAEEGMILAL